MLSRNSLCSSFALGALLVVLSTSVSLAQATGPGSGIGTRGAGQATPGLGSGSEGGALENPGPRISDPAARTPGDDGGGQAREGTYDQGSTLPADHGASWGWLGLIGLAGLAGLLRRAAFQNEQDPSSPSERGTAA